MFSHFSKATEADQVADELGCASYVLVKRLNVSKMKCRGKRKLIARRIEYKLLLDLALEFSDIILQQI